MSDPCTCSWGAPHGDPCGPVSWAIKGEDGEYLVNCSDPDRIGYFRSARVSDRKNALRFTSLAAARRVFASQPGGCIVRLTRRASRDRTATK